MKNFDKRMRKAFIDLCKSIDKGVDETYQKLYDRVSDLQLSHNRMRKLLKMTLNFLEGQDPDRVYLHKRITLELYGLENYKGLKGGRK